MKREMGRRLLISAGLAALAGLAGCSSNGKAAQVAAQAPAAVPVRVAQSVKENLPITVEAIGTGEAYSNVQVETLVTGELSQAFFKQGDFVRKGQLLFTLDPGSFQAALDQANGDLERDTAQAKIAVVTAARYKQLFEQGVVSRQQYDQYQSQADSANATVVADRAAVEAARLQLSYCKIYSPMNGKTGSLAVFPGNVVKANSTPALVTINQINPIYVDFSVPENLLGKVREALDVRAPVEAYTQNETQHPEIGRLSFIDNTVDATTGTIKLKGTFGNADRRLWPGEFVQVKLRLGEESGVTVVPSIALQNSQDGNYVWVVDKNDTVQMRTVTVQRQEQGKAVIATGLQPGETVVTEGQLRLVPGSKVEIRTSL